MIDPFWIKLQQAYNEVAARHDTKVTIEEGGYKATIYFEGRLEQDAIFVIITEVEREKPTLIVP